MVEDSLDTRTANAINKPQRHFCQTISTQPPSTSLTGSLFFPSIETGRAMATGGTISTVAGVDAVVVVAGSLTGCDGFGFGGSPIFGNSRKVWAQYW